MQLKNDSQLTAQSTDLPSGAAVVEQVISDGPAQDLDHLELSAFRTRQLCVRIAQSQVCRENVWREDETTHMLAHWQGREAACELGPDDAATVSSRVKALSASLRAQAPDREAVCPTPPPGRFVWQPTDQAFAEAYPIERIYAAVERCASEVRGRGLRLTGYLEAKEGSTYTVARSASGSFHRSFGSDHGLSLQVTVDDERTGAVGSTARAVVGAGAGALDDVISEAVTDALRICQSSASPSGIEAGDYTVVLGPSAVLDLLQTTLSYGLFDRRKIDESRSFLSGKLAELSFPESLRLRQTPYLTLPNGSVYADRPLNDRHAVCSGLDLIADGRIRDLHTSAYWSQVTGHAETFDAWSAPPLSLTADPDSPLAHDSIDDLIASTERGIYVVNTWYLRMVAEMQGTITGMTRDGLYEIRDGKIVRPLINMRWHDNPYRILSAVTGVTRQARVLGLPRMVSPARQSLALVPALRVQGFHFSSQTQF